MTNPDFLYYQYGGLHVFFSSFFQTVHTTVLYPMLFRTVSSAVGKNSWPCSIYVPSESSLKLRNPSTHTSHDCILKPEISSRSIHKPSDYCCLCRLYEVCNGFQMTTRFVERCSSIRIRQFCSREKRLLLPRSICRQNSLRYHNPSTHTCHDCI